MATPATLCSAITACFLADATLRQLVPSGIWLDVVPENAALPWVVLRHKGESPQWTFSPVYSENGAVAFECYSVWAQTAEQVAFAVRAAFDHQMGPDLARLPFDLDPQTAHLDKWLRTSYKVGASPFRSAQGDVIFAAVVEYESAVERVLRTF